MRKSVIIISLLLLAVNLHAQKKYTIVYQTSFGPYDSIKGTTYIPYHLVIQDSISYCYYPEFDVAIFRKAPNPLGSHYWPKMLYYNSKGDYTLSHEDGKKNKLTKRACERGKWKISDETKIICGYQCIKATGTRRGMTYTVWYTTELPAGLGGFMFSTLPGTILESEDQRGYFSTATEVRKDGIQIVEPSYCKVVEKHN